MPLLSVVVPCFNEQEVIATTYRRLTDTLSRLPGLEYEVLFVDDGSRDDTRGILRTIQQGDPRVRFIALARNFGHQIAVTGGIEHAAGDAVVLIDADLQDPPEVIREMVEMWQQGYEVVYGVRTDRPGESAFKLWTARVFYRLIARLSETPIAVDTGDFRLMDRKVVDALLLMPERDRFIRGMVGWVGFRQVGLPYRREPRAQGESKYPLAKMMRFAIDGITSFSTVPLRVATWLGFSAAAFALLLSLWALAARLFTTQWVPGWAALFITVLFMGGVQLIALGIIGEYVGRTYLEAKHRPLYLVAEKTGFDVGAKASSAVPIAPRAVKRDLRQSPNPVP
jgi:dolichol-phosphate mannosyltransferase